MTSGPGDHPAAKLLADGLPIAQPHRVHLNAYIPLAATVNGARALVLYLRRWHDGSFHQETVHLAQDDGNWSEISTESSALGTAPFDRSGEGWSGELVRLFEQGVSFEDGAKEGWRYVVGMAATGVIALELETPLDRQRFDDLFESPTGAFVLLARAAHPQDICALRVETQQGAVERVDLGLKEESRSDVVFSSTSLKAGSPTSRAVVGRKPDSQ